MAELLDRLLLVVFENGKCGLVQICDQPLFVIEHGRVQSHFLHFRAEDERAAFVRWLLFLISCACSLLPVSST